MAVGSKMFRKHQLCPGIKKTNNKNNEIQRMKLIKSRAFLFAAVALGLIPELLLSQPSSDHPDGLYLDKPGTPNGNTFLSAWDSGTNLRTAELSSYNGGLYFYSGRNESGPGYGDGGINLQGNPISLVMSNSESSNPDDANLNVYKASTWGAGQPLLNINGLNGNTTLNHSNVFINNGSLNVGGLITSAGSQVITTASASTQLSSLGFVTASAVGVVNLAGTTPGISANGTSIFSLDATGKVNYATSRQISINSPTLSTGSTTGALTVTGGIGVGMDSWINGIRIGRGNGNISSNLTLGSGALQTNSTGVENSALGFSALLANTSGLNNTAVGSNSLRFNTTGQKNTAVGQSVLYSNVNGNYNTSVGNNSLFFMNTGNFNVALGIDAGSRQSSGTALTDPENSIYIGAYSKGKDNLDNNSIVIGYGSVGQGANTTVIGNSSTISARIYGNLVVGAGTGSPVLTQATAATSYLAANPPSIRGLGSILSNGGIVAMGNGAQATNSGSVAIGGYSTIAAGSGSLALGNYSNCSEGATDSAALVGGIVTNSYSLAVAYGEASGAMSFATGAGAAAGDSSIAIGGFDFQQGNWPGNQSSGENSASIGGVGNVAGGFSSFSSGFWTKASSYGAIALGSLNVGSSSSPDTWVETDPLFELGNGDAPRSYQEPTSSTRSNAITTLKNGQTTLTNKAWKADPEVAPSAENSNGNALVVEGHTVLNGKVVVSVPQGDISMGIYQ